jgi:ribulose bisphosphate carboxylase small subunit
MEKFYWEPDRSDRIGIVGGIFAPDGLSSQDVTMLVDTFPHQAIDFFGAVRAQIYNEQIRDFIDAVGIENVSRSVVNTLTPPTFRKPDFTLSHLIEVGYRLVGEQRRVDDSHLANEYNRVLQSGHAAAGTGPFYRAYPAANGSPAVSSPEHRAADDNSAACPLPAVQNSKFNVQTISALPAEVGDQINTLLAQGYHLALEHVDQRRFRTNAWQSGPALPSQNVAMAAAALERCLEDYAQHYIRLLGIDPKTKQRVVERIIHRPSG